MQKVMADDVLLNAMVSTATITSEATQSGRKLLLAGNGGSAADAQHLVAEFVARLTVNRLPLRAIALDGFLDSDSDRERLLV
jgi:D-sedoheptulose 7-phosphate isomerase